MTKLAKINNWISREVCSTSYLIAVLVAFALIASLAACGGGNDPTGPKPDPTPYPSPTPTPIPVTVNVSITPTGYVPRDLGTLPKGTKIVYRNNDAVIHQPQSKDSAMVSCSAIFPGESCTSTTYNYDGVPIRVSVNDLRSADKSAEVNSFIVDK